ncbi:hypothetical protein PTTG_27195 [Puccinia triticina 1-1 BBBD Race 1]|uniref:HAT C-terminal dimerisation domain-containing protein n=1 Tax=Puccinia triticina (isolate 1-1 / race 1 (BBBD)) TaxID=630390 RepID=A0A180GN29_PUCT1|nr:hypothetical protein PTTG_27195 [Puccinia triticina 1-1 BBBD Race 1]
MASNCKRRRPNTSASSPSSYQNNNNNNSAQTTSRDHLVTPGSTQPPSGRTRDESDEEEVLRAQRIAANGQSLSYKSYLVPELSKQLDKNNQRMITYPFKICGTKINRPTLDLSCSNLIKHAATCLRKQSKQKSNVNLARVGIKGTGDIDPKEVPQICVVWCAKAARPFSALVDASHKAILHPTVVKNLPARQVVSEDIHRLYSAIQQKYELVLEAHKGALYLGVDAWQSPNGFDILGIIIYRLAGNLLGEPKLEDMPLDFVCLSQIHTGHYLAETIRLVVEKFGIQQKLCGIVSNNATNNDVMVKELKKQQWPPSKGSHSGFQAKEDATYCSENDDESKAGLYDPKDPDEFELLGMDDINHPSNKEEDDQYTTKGCRNSLAKFCVIAKKLKYLPNSKAEFVDICRENGCDTPHNVEWDVRTQWNSTLVQINSIVQCEAAICKWQHHKQLGIDCKFHLDKYDLDLARDLLEILSIFYKITLQILISGSARLSNIVVFIDQITKHLSTAISGSKYPPALKNACQIGLKITNKYYSLTDNSPLYRIAIILHPLFRDKYFKLLRWEPEWIAEAIQLAREMWVTFYKPDPTPPNPSTSLSKTSKAKSSMLAGLGEAAAARRRPLLKQSFGYLACRGTHLGW